MLKRHLTGITYTNSVPWKVQSGMLADPYTGTTISFVRVSGTSSKVQINHVVALSDAWQKDAQKLTTERRTAFANDPLNLQATDGPTNQKGRRRCRHLVATEQGVPVRVRGTPGDSEGVACER
ncbi:HNH endonuclease family protein [Pseudarthrobacter phenanthrenivorans]|uniref:HNH endonuclease family protein n=1 Tax=Pseudarthrobacter phenanthrenivorans TaxID=361575 RepID=UPI0002F506DF|nr:HNH endonuclease family protein [Pseudarthrobacter phenanthrenivorans]